MNVFFEHLRFYNKITTFQIHNAYFDLLVDAVFSKIKASEYIFLSITCKKHYLKRKYTSVRSFSEEYTKQYEEVNIFG